MLNIPIPPQPVIPDNIAYMYAGGFFILGVALILWGRFLSRPLMAIVCGWTGVLLAQPMMVWFPSLTQNSLLLQISLGSILGTLGFVLAPLIFVVAAASLCVVIVWLFAIVSYAQTMETQIILETTADFRQWVTVVFDFLKSVNSEMLKTQSGKLILMLMPALLIPLIIGIWRSRFITILMTGLCGSVIAVGAVMIAITHTNKTLWPASWEKFILPACIIGGLFVISVIFQYVRILASKRKKKEGEKEETPDEELEQK